MLYTYLSVSRSDVKILMYFSSISVVNIACFFISDALNWSGLQNEGFSGQICEASDADWFEMLSGLALGLGLNAVGLWASSSADLRRKLCDVCAGIAVLRCFCVTLAQTGTRSSSDDFDLFFSFCREFEVGGVWMKEAVMWWISDAVAFKHRPAEQIHLNWELIALASDLTSVLLWQNSRSPKTTTEAFEHFTALAIY